MPKYWGKQIFTHGRFPEVGQKQKTEREKKRKKDRTMVITMAKLCMAHASCLGQNSKAPQSSYPPAKTACPCCWQLSNISIISN